MADGPKRFKSALALPDDLIANVIEFAADSMHPWSLLHRVNRQFRRCALKPWSATHILWNLHQAADLERLGQAVHGVRKLKLRTASNLHALPTLFALQELDLRRATDAHITYLARCSNLESLDLSQSDSITNQGVSNLSALTSLRTLRILGCHSITDLTPLSHLVKLRDLTLDSCSDLFDLRPLARLTTLQTLSFDGCDSLTDDSLQALSNLFALQSLDLSDCALLSNNGLSALSELKGKSVV